MKRFELMYLCGERFLSPLHGQVRCHLAKLAKSHTGRMKLLDVGGRRSRYTIGIPADVTVSDLPRETEIQHHLALGLTEGMLAQMRRRRSNIQEILFDDMTRSKIPSHSFDCIVAVEVLEHVEEDALFISEVHRVLKPGGRFIMTTPNGDFLKIPHGDHKRHYTREGLRDLLATCFGKVEVEYAIQTGFHRKLGRQSWALRHPLRTLGSMYGNFVNSVQCGRESIKTQSQGTLHLFANVTKQAYVSDQRDAVRHEKQAPLRVSTNAEPPALAAKAAAHVIAINLPATNNGNGHLNNGHIFEGRTLNISATGISFVVPEIQARELKALADNETLHITLNIPSSRTGATQQIEMRVAPVRFESTNEGDPASMCRVASQIKEINNVNRALLIDYLRTFCLPFMLLTVLLLAPFAPGANAPRRNDFMEKDRSEGSQQNYALHSSRPKRRSKDKVI